jgi:hypothetical protein
MSKNTVRELGRRTLMIAGLGLAMLFCGAPPGQAQEVSPDHFTATGVETFEGASARTAVRKKERAGNAQSVNLASRIAPTLPTLRSSRHRRKRNTASAAGK